ncbi:DUF4244 domain-containing protein [Nonomuraea soli]|uniref:DUF4244 domain-containing protein n=1 Tax=Nonomuraea soli TaxID=1032476 RepID=A0A7W0CHM9_9ACTN|nr:DUF4244 domain-containing protein [Nonomuraea soli]MBA2891366.1 hypothetical protein [Nonomuraea soli]
MPDEPNAVVAVTSSPKPPLQRLATRRRALLARLRADRLDRGMSTAEYAVGTIAACAFAALLYKVVSSPEVQEMLSSLVDQALNTNG